MEPHPGELIDHFSMQLTTTNVLAGAAMFAAVGATDYLLDKSLKRALIVGAVAVLAAFVIEAYANTVSTAAANQNSGL